MSKADKDFKKEFDSEYANASYAGRKIGGKVVLWIIVLVIGVSLLGGGLKLYQTNVDRLIFKQSVTYNEGVLDDLAKYRLEMIRSENEIEKKAIAEMVTDRFSNYDQSKIENSDLKKFLSDCLNFTLEDY